MFLLVAFVAVLAAVTYEARRYVPAAANGLAPSAPSNNLSAAGIRESLIGTWELVSNGASYGAPGRLQFEYGGWVTHPKLASQTTGMKGAADTRPRFRVSDDLTLQMDGDYVTYTITEIGPYTLGLRAAGSSAEYRYTRVSQPYVSSQR